MRFNWNHVQQNNNAIANMGVSASFVSGVHNLHDKKFKWTIQFRWRLELSKMFTLISVVINWKHKNSFAFLIIFQRFFSIFQ